MTHKFIPPHLRQYIVDQEYEKYSAVDHAVWRFIMRISIDFFKDYAHKSYLEGLEKTGISIDKIPLIDDIDYKLSKFGWGAVCVRGFIPPAAFMELQSLGILPIASDMRTLSHLTYTPAPDIVHEAAGHAPILADQKYADYLRKYGEVANKAISSNKDNEVYYAIRYLSDVKENPNSKSKEIIDAEEKLNNAISNIEYVSEAALLARMNWWTVEYGLIGDIDNYKIYGAGLLSSVGESQSCLKKSISKIPFSLDCINQNYNITEPQPQLFVADNFDSLSDALDEIKSKMAFTVGGSFGLGKALESKTVCSVLLNSNMQISGILSRYIECNNSEPCYLQFDGPVQLCRYNHQIDNHGGSYHKDGYGTAIGKVVGYNKSIYDFNDDDIQKLNLIKNEDISISFESGITINGMITNIMQKNGRILLVSFSKCLVKYGNEILFDPSWGVYDMVCGESVDSVYGGPADFEEYSAFMPEYSVKAINNTSTTTNNSASEDSLHNLYRQVNSMLEKKYFDKESIDFILKKIKDDHPKDWLLKMNILEVAKNNNILIDGLFDEINSLADKTELGQVIKRGLNLLR